MSKDVLGTLPQDPADWDAAWSAVRRLDAARRGVERDAPEDRNYRRHTDPDQLARDIAEIERASAALRNAEPALEAWTDQPSRPSSQPRSVWLMIGVLWLSTALVTAGAVVAIATFVG